MCPDADPSPVPDPARDVSPGGEAEARGARGRELPPFVAILGAALLAVLLRLLCVGLPIEGDAVAYGALGRSLASFEGYEIDGAAHDRYPPGHPVVLAIALLGGGTVTTTSRVVGLVEGAGIAALLAALAVRLTRGRAPLLPTVALAGGHPTLALFAGGLVVGSEGTALLALLVAWRLALSPSPRARLGALLLTGLLPLIRYDLVAFPIVVGVYLLRTAPGRTLGARARAVAPVLLTLALPLLAFVVRTWLVSGRPFGTGYAAHGLSLGRIPKNVLVFAALVLPTAGLGLLWLVLPSGLGRLADTRGADRTPVRLALAGSALHVLLVLVFSGPTYAGDGALGFSSGSLRFGLAALPVLLLAGLVGLAARPPRVRGPLGLALAVAAPLMSFGLLCGPLQRALPFRAQAAGRLDLLADAYDAAVREAGPKDWIALDLAARRNAGVEVFLGDRAPSRRTGVVAAAKVPRGVFPRAPELPLRDGLSTDLRCWLVSDRTYDGVVFTGERPDLGRGGQGVFQRIAWKDVPGGAAGSYTIHQVIRPPR